MQQIANKRKNISKTSKLLIFTDSLFILLNQNNEKTTNKTNEHTHIHKKKKKNQKQKIKKKEKAKKQILK